MDSSLIINFFTAIMSLFLAWFTAPTPHVTVPTETTAEVVAVIDGDTIVVHINGTKETVRYIGIDTPEPRREGAPECGSHEATEYNRELVESQTVRLVADVEDRDQYDRLLRYVYVDTEEGEVLVNQALLAAGLATPLTIRPNTAMAKTFAAEAYQAKNNDVGNWALCPDF